MNYEKAREAYENDPTYHRAVDAMIHMVRTLETTPAELREMAMFACILFEETNTRPKYYGRIEK